MPYDPLNEKILEIENRLRDLTPEQRDKIRDWIKKGKQRSDNIKKAVRGLQDSLDTLRVLVKYMMFDLEATRRENIFMREQLSSLHEELESRGYYAENPPSGMLMLPPPNEDGTIDLPDTGDFIHNNECDHPYDPNCWCDQCEALRERREQ